jgi:hypothetical protein
MTRQFIHPDIEKEWFPPVDVRQLARQFYTQTQRE